MPNDATIPAHVCVTRCSTFRVVLFKMKEQNFANLCDVFKRCELTNNDGERGFYLILIFSQRHLRKHVCYYSRTLNPAEMWLRSERISRRLRGRLSLSGVSASKGTGHRAQLGTARKLPSINSSSRAITSGRYGRLSQWRRRSSNFLKEVSRELVPPRRNSTQSHCSSKLRAKEQFVTSI